MAHGLRLMALAKGRRPPGPGAWGMRIAQLTDQWLINLLVQLMNWIMPLISEIFVFCPTPMSYHIRFYSFQIIVGHLSCFETAANSALVSELGKNPVWGPRRVWSSIFNDNLPNNYFQKVHTCIHTDFSVVDFNVDFAEVGHLQIVLFSGLVRLPTFTFDIHNPAFLSMPLHMFLRYCTPTFSPT